jgi:hypothetical protein
MYGKKIPFSSCVENIKTSLAKGMQIYHLQFLE